MAGSNSKIVLPQDVTFARAEQVFRRSKQLAEGDAPRIDQVAAALRAVKARDPKLLYGMERMIEVLHAAYEDQLGQTQRRTSLEHTARVRPHIVTAYENAYRVAVDDAYNHAALQPYGYLYAAVGEFVGILF